MTLSQKSSGHHHEVQVLSQAPSRKPEAAAVCHPHRLGTAVGDSGCCGFLDKSAIAEVVHCFLERPCACCKGLHCWNKSQKKTRHADGSGTSDRLPLWTILYAHDTAGMADAAAAEQSGHCC